MRTSPVTSSAYSDANMTASAPPKEWPTTTYGPGSPIVCQQCREGRSPAVVKVAVAVAGSLVPVPGRSYEHTRARAAMAGSTLTQPVVSPPKPAISSTVVSPWPTQRTCTRSPSAPTSSSIVAVGRATVVTVVVGASAVIGVVGGASVVTVVVGASGDVVDVLVVEWWDGRGRAGAGWVVESLPHAAALTSAAARRARPRRARTVGRRRSLRCRRERVV